jgi:hypothetical protein
MLRLDLFGLTETREMLAAMERRLEDLEPAWTEIFRIMERGERRVFARYGGKYVDTGATRDSLTQAHAGGAIRDFHPVSNTATFGTSVTNDRGDPYPRFLRLPDHSSAVLRADSTTRRQAAEIMMRYVTGEARL